MRIVRVHETAEADHRRVVKQVFEHHTVVDCGVAVFAPGECAHCDEEHRHADDEVFVILSGEVTVPITGGPTGVARAGDWVHVRAGEEHHLTNHTHLPCVAMYLMLRGGWASRDKGER